MNKREWKYLRRKYMYHKGYWGFKFISYTIPTPKSYDRERMDNIQDEPFGNFAMMIPREPYKPPPPYSAPIRTRSQQRFNAPTFSGLSTWDGKKIQHIYTDKSMSIITTRNINPFKLYQK